MSNLVEYTAPQWRNLNMRKLKVDEAYLVPISHFDKPTYLYALSDECYSCPFSKLKEIHKNSKELQINIARPLQLRLFGEDLGRYAFQNDTPIYEFAGKLEEFGVYNLSIDAEGHCDLIVDKAGVDVNLSFLSAFVLVALILSLIRMTWCAWQSYRYDAEAAIALDANVSGETTPAVTQQKRRMQSLDAFRGLAIVLMIFVNSGGGGYWWIEHAAWNGLHLADVVFPSFLWIMGVCIPISVRSQLSRGTGKFLICKRIIWRSIKLFAIGLCLNSINGPQLEDLRVMGVLQRFGIAYLICGILHTIFSKRQTVMPQNAWKRRFYDMLLFKGEYLSMLALIALNLGIIFGYNTPDCPKGYLGPGGKHANAAYPNCIGGAVGYIDKQILGKNIYQHPTAKYIYDSTAFDPEGIFGCILTVVQVLYGVLCGVQILIYADYKERLKRWLTWSVGLGLLGGILCSFSKEIGPIPVNKNLWSLSYVFVTTSLAFAILSALYWIIDIKNWYSGFPFVESGKNAIIMYVGHTIMHKMLPWHWRIGAMNTHFILLLESTWNTLLWIGIAIYLNSIEFYYSL